MGVLVDTNVLVFAVDTRAREHSRAREELAQVREYVVNPIILAELHHTLSAKIGKPASTAQVEALVERVAIEEVSSFAAEAMRLSRETCLTTNDAIIAQHALDRGHELLTFDADFRRVSRLRLKQLRP